jgi:acetyl esterase/lipase
MRLTMKRILGFAALGVAAMPSLAEAQRTFPISERPLSDDLDPAAVKVWPGGVTSQADIRYAAVSGYRRLTLDLYMPPSTGEAKPLILYVHGGGWMNSDSRHMGAIADLPALFAQLAGEGFVVASIEYRHGKEARFPAQVQDVRAALRFLKENATRFGIDPARTGIMGGSAGAHLASLAALSCGDKSLDASDTKAPEGSECVQAFVGWYGVYDASALAAERPTGRDGAIEALMGCDGTCPTDKLAAVSPVTYLDRRDPPTLLIHGTEDKVVPVSQSRLLEARMKAAGVPVQAIYISGVDHSFIGKTPAEIRSATLQAVNASFDFFHQKLDRKK